MKRIMTMVTLAMLAGPVAAAVEPAKVKSAGKNCPCALKAQCTGPRGGHYCITPKGSKKYQ